MRSQQYNKLIGLGAYTLEEASLYGGLSPNKLSRWVFGTEIYQPVIESRLMDLRLVSFYDLVQAMAINRAREEGVSLHKIRQAIKTAKEKYQVDFPLAYKHELVLFDNDLHIVFPDETIVQVSGRQQGQRAMKPIVEPFMKDLHFNTEGYTIRFTPFESNGRQIILDPQVQFGQPLVGTTGYRADVLDNAFSTEGSSETVATLYNVDIEDVEAAVAYMKNVRKAA